MDNSSSIQSPVGGAWLARTYDIEPVQPLRHTSRIGKSRSSFQKTNRWEVTYPESYRPEETLAGHLEFLLKHERVHLELLARLFSVIPSGEIESWIKREPTGQYARRSGFLYEWLTGETLDFDGVKNGGYVDAIDPERHFCATKGMNVPRWRVRDNLPGSREFCPTILLTEETKMAQTFDVKGGWMGLEDEFGADLLARSAVWITIKESRSSFAIEGETDPKDRIRRFASAMEEEVGRRENPLELEALAQLQRTILGDHATQHGVRQSPIFIGESRRGEEIVHYIAPHWEKIRGMLEGLTLSDQRTTGASPVLRATALSFGFVYIHPLSDGNGRISRFLINDSFRRDGVLPTPFVLPVSAVISSALRDYDRTLEVLSKPLMRRYSRSVRFGTRERFADGFTSDFHFDAYLEAEPTWRYPDLTDHAVYMHEVVRRTLDEEMRREARQIRAHRNARKGVNEVIEGPDQDLDRIVRSVRDNRWTVSNKLREEFPLLNDPTLAERIVSAVIEAFEPDVSRVEDSILSRKG